LVPPPTDSSAAESERYDAALAEALGRQIGRGVEVAERRRIATSVAGLTWRATYGRMREIYARVRG
jgi:hypothetical protein